MPSVRNSHIAVRLPLVRLRDTLPTLYASEVIGPSHEDVDAKRKYHVTRERCPTADKYQGEHMHLRCGLITGKRCNSLTMQDRLWTGYPRNTRVIGPAEQRSQIHLFRIKAVASQEKDEGSAVAVTHVPMKDNDFP